MEMEKNSVSPVWEISLQVKLERSMRTPRCNIVGKERCVETFEPDRSRRTLTPRFLGLGTFKPHGRDLQTPRSRASNIRVGTFKCRARDLKTSASQLQIPGSVGRCIGVVVRMLGVAMQTSGSAP